MDKEKQLDELTAETLMTLVKEHKEKCDGNCGMSMWTMLNVYKDLVKRDLTTEEVKVFM